MVRESITTGLSFPSTVNEPTTPIKAVASGKATTSRRLTYEETQAFNRGEDIRITKAIEKEYPALKTITKRAPKRTTRKTTKVNTFKRDVLDARVHCAMGPKGQPFTNDDGVPCVRRFAPNGEGSVNHLYHTFA